MRPTKATLLLTYMSLVTTIQFYPATLKPAAATIAGVLFTTLIALTLIRRNPNPLTIATLLSLGLAATWGHIEVLTSFPLPHIPVLALPVLICIATVAIQRLTPNLKPAR